MRYQNGWFVMSIAVCGLFFTGISNAALKPTGFPQTFQDVSFTQRMQTKKTGYEPYKNSSAYVIPKFNETDDDFKKAMCERDHDECCRRWPDYPECQPQIIYEKYGGSIDHCQQGDAKTQTGWAAPTFYRTDRGATITCIPKRNHSLFMGWCTDAGLKNCAPTQTIAVGEKDDKHFWAKWSCVAPAIPTGDGQGCKCPNPNMNPDTCRCDGVGMMEEPGNSSNCVCIANYDAESHEKTDILARINNGKCECLNPEMDINTDCTTRKTACTDTDHMDPLTCECLPTGQTKDISGTCTCVDNNNNPDDNQEIVGSGATGHCECKDTQNMEKDEHGKCKCKNGVDINEHPDCNPGSTPPPTASTKYVIMQCRTDGTWDPIRISGWKKTSDVGTAIGCRDGNYDAIANCFKQCSGRGNDNYTVHYLNDTVEGAYPRQNLSSFCSGENSSGDHEFFLKDETDPSKLKIYTPDEMSKVWGSLTGKGDISYCKVHDGWWHEGYW